MKRSRYALALLGLAGVLLTAVGEAAAEEWRDVQIRNPATDRCLLELRGFGFAGAGRCGVAGYRFDVVQAPRGTVNDLIIRPVANPYVCLDAVVPLPGQTVRFNPCVASPRDPRARAQLWMMEPVRLANMTLYRFVSRSSFHGGGLCLEAPREGGAVLQRSCARAPASNPYQLWAIEVARGR